MSIPKVKFSILPLDEIVSSIQGFLNPGKGDWDWSDPIYQNYPDLKGRLKNVKNKKEKEKIQYLFFKEFFDKEKPKLEKRMKIFQSGWDKINDKVMLVLSDVVEQKWPVKDKEFSARISLNPICPRYIKQRAFDIFFRQKPRHMKSTAIHEIFHFIYFEKWKKVFPETSEKEFDYPHFVWQLSEMVPGIVLNDKRIQNVFKYKFDSYEEYENFKLEGKPLLSYLQNFYDSRKDFEDFLKKLWKFVKKHEKKIKSI